MRWAGCRIETGVKIEGLFANTSSLFSVPSLVNHFDFFFHFLFFVSPFFSLTTVTPHSSRRDFILTCFEGVQTRAQGVLLLYLSLFAANKKESPGGKCCHPITMTDNEA